MNSGSNLWVLVAENHLLNYFQDVCFPFSSIIGESDSVIAMYTIARQNTISSQRLWTFCIGLLLLKFAVGTSLKALHRAPRSVRVVNSYFVHVHPEISWDRVQELLEELQVLDSDKEKPGFKASVQGTVTQAGYGFAAHLSEQALTKVRVISIFQLK